MSIKRIGVLTSGGDAPGMNPCVRAVVRTALYHGIECYGIRRGYNGLIHGDVIKLDVKTVSHIIDRGGTILYTARSAEFMTQEGQLKAVATCKFLGLDGVIAIGGDGTFRGAEALSKHGINVICIPATIDNDICCTNYSIGFDTAANTAIECIDKLRDTMQSHERCSIVEVMGRDTGWLTASSAVLRANGEVAPHLIYLPERPFSIKQFLEDIREQQKKHYAVIVAVSEGIGLDPAEVGEEFQSGKVDSFGHLYLSGVGKALEKIVSRELKCKVRSIELNVMQRCSSHLSSKRDVDEAERIGGAGVKAALEDGLSGIAMCFKRVSNHPYNARIISADVNEIANRVKYFPKEWINEAGNNVTNDAIEYTLPLLAGEQNLHIKNGLPVHFVLQRELKRFGK